MSKYIFDYDDGDFAMSISDSMAMDSDGNLMMRMGDHMAMDMDTGDIHMISSWSDDDEEYPHHRRHAAHGRRQHRPQHRKSSTAGGHFRAGVGNCPGPGGKAENDRLQALCGPQAQIRHRLRLRDQRPSLRGTLLAQVARRQETRPQCLRPYPRGV